MAAFSPDPYHTQVEFAAKHFGMMTVRGTFTEVKVSGEVFLDDPNRSHLEVTINVNSLRTHNSTRDKDLLSSNFLEVDKFPTVTWKSKKFEPKGDDQGNVTGDLTIKGVTKPVTLKVVKYGELNDAMMGHRVSYAAETEINRKDFGMTFEMMADGRFVVANEIQINIEGELIEQKEAAQEAVATSASRTSRDLP
jgi:polyisoprenoid-binding protein YceI